MIVAARNHILSEIAACADTVVEDLLRVDPENFIGAYIDHYNKIIDVIVATGWFEDLSYKDKSYAIVYLNYQFSQLVLEAVLGGNIDDNEAVATLRKKLEALDARCDERTRNHLVPLLRELDAVQTDVAPIGLSRRINVLTIEGADVYDDFISVLEEGVHAAKEEE